jgi:hypothetical protein
VVQHIDTEGEERKIPMSGKIQPMSSHNAKIFASPDALKKEETHLVDDLMKQYASNP